VHGRGELLELLALERRLLLEVEQVEVGLLVAKLGAVLLGPLSLLIVASFRGVARTVLNLTELEERPPAKSRAS
jgi:hypothetical protein